MDDADVAETTRLLPPESVTESPPEETYGVFLRRHSSSCLPSYYDNEPVLDGPDEPRSALTIWTIVPVSLLGVFVANLDGSLVVASSQQIASEFHSLSQASWLITSFVLAQCASQPLYGKLSDIFGRRSNLTAAYVFFATGCFLCGISRAYWQVLAGRAISGIGGAGMAALVSIIIADVVPVREIASWRSYVNVAATVGRALGGPVGGWLCDMVGWRWCFYGQVPPTLLGLILILWRLPNRPSKEQTLEEDGSLLQKVTRVDMVGAFVLAVAISIFLLTLHFANENVSLVNILVLVVLGIISAFLFYLIERRWAKEPILPIELVTKRAALSSYILAGFQLAAQFSLFYSTPLYFQIVSGSSVGDSGLRLVPAVAGNAIAGLLSGYVISQTGRYKLLTILSNLAGCVGYVLVLLRWRGNTNWAETLYISFGGFASGANQSTTFIHLAASLDPSEIAIAGTTLYLSQSLFLLVGIQLATAVLRARLRINLNTSLKGIKHQAKIIESAISSVGSVRKLPPHVREIVIQAYVDGLSGTFCISVIFSVLGLVVGLSLQERRL
ncbi:uncharacterized protein Z518_05117 [Rhinocladiella mackenziei CBS 650.93]|uniref:Major facilitator superfamily (MFS) profile domain-containing protein n=1 Tax=Rhinocladiella mackenziei CBS 650.93 TaxID=1442369 RepID=A0A0D2JD99_9EURO|nr:uncharacterized protein Z518_05117 [Rhinocladiella mackenziei CBS 650.93]KIX07140.1 hypothetical protein Z518_05117 [Rhinocladiella mackenziei CBS 650.93]